MANNVNNKRRRPAYLRTDRYLYTSYRFGMAGPFRRGGMDK